MNKELIDVCLNPEDPNASWRLARWYEEQGQYAPAHTYYQRCSERIQDDIGAYRALIRSSICYKNQGSRDFTAKASLENCIALLPQRPEAYFFLSELYEQRKDWQNSYLYAQIGEQWCTDDLVDIDIPEYPGKYGHIFQRAVVGWHWGKNYECRELFQVLVNEYWDVMNDEHRNLTEKNITSLGCGPVEVSHTRYKKEDHSLLRYKFPGSENLANNCSQIYQDMFTLSILDGKRNGTYLEIGGGDPYHGNNTAVLEKQYGWKGVSLEWDNDLYNKYREERSNPIFAMDALDSTLDYGDFIDEHLNTNVVDLLQLDIEPARKTYELLDKIPWDRYKFRVILYEHDYYVDVTRSFREKSRKRLSELGYVMVVNDMSADGKSTFEDWWVHPDMVDPELVRRMTSIQDGVQKAKDYMLSSGDSLPVKKYNTFGECECEWCEGQPFPRLYSLGDGQHWFEIPKNGSASIKGHFPECKLVEGTPITKPIVVIDDPVDRFVSLLNDYFVIPNYHNIWGDDILKFIGLSLDDSKEDILRGVMSNLDKITTHQQVHHWYPQTHFIDQKNYQEFEVISKSDINERFGIDNHYNSSKKVFQRSDLSHKDIVIIKSIYESDYRFIQKTSVKSEVKFHSLSTKQNDTLWIVDNFYEKPDEVRNFALNEPFFEGGFGRGFIGRRSENQYLFPGLKEKFEDIMGKKITKWEEHEQNGRFQSCWSGEALVYHCDSQQWGGMLYLTPGAPYQCGTTLYAHKQTRARTYYEPGWDAAWDPEKYPEDCHLDGTHFEPVDVAGNVYNRLVLFDASAIHSASEYFGTTLKTGRLWQMFFFDT